MGKGHYFTVPYYTTAWGGGFINGQYYEHAADDKLLFINACDLTPYSEHRQESIVPNTDIPTLLKSEPCCSIIVESTNADQTLRLTFTGKLTANADHSINYDDVEHYVTINRGVNENDKLD